MRNLLSDKTAKSARAIRLLTLLGALAMVAAVGGIAYAASQGPAVQDPAITSGPADQTNATSARLTFRGEGPGAQTQTFQCSLDSAAFTACTSPKLYTGPLAQGRHTFQVRARSSAGQYSSTTGTSWIVDTQAPPAPSIVDGPPSLSASDRATFRFADAEAHVRFACRIDGRLDACDSPASYRGLRDGLHSFSVQASDAAGNTSPVSARSWTVDTAAPPQPKITQHPANPSNDLSATFAFTEAEAGAALECRLDSGAWAGCTSPLSYGSLGAATHHFSVRAFDAAGNRSGSAGYDWTVTAQNGQPFAVSGNLTGLLVPGLSGTLVLKVSNPNSVPIFVTSLTVTVKPGSTKAGCDGPANLQVTQSNASAATPLTIPANGNVTLPSGGIATPQVLMKNLPTNQDACKGATFTFTYGGSAHS
jgi:hypothetical protein